MPVVYDTVNIGRAIPRDKNCGHEMAIVGEPCNVDAHANFSDLFMTNICAWMCVHMYCTHCTLYSCLVDGSEHRIHPGDTTHTHMTQDTRHKTQTKSNVELGFPD